MKFKRHPVSKLIAFAREQDKKHAKRIEPRGKPHQIVDEMPGFGPRMLNGMLFNPEGFN